MKLKVLPVKHHPGKCQDPVPRYNWIPVSIRKGQAMVVKTLKRQPPCTAGMTIVELIGAAKEQP